MKLIEDLCIAMLLLAFPTAALLLIMLWGLSRSIRRKQRQPWRVRLREHDPDSSARIRDARMWEEPK